MHSRLTTLLLTLSLAVIHAASTFALTRSSIRTSLAKANLTTARGSIARHTQNTTSSPADFLGVECYHLKPEIIDLHTCQPLLTSIFEAGHVYEKNSFPNGWYFRKGNNPCIIKLESPAREDRYARISISIAEIVRYTTEVLENCETGGANNFLGSWRVVVTRNVDKVYSFTRGGDALHRG